MGNNGGYPPVYDQMISREDEGPDPLVPEPLSTEPDPKAKKAKPAKKTRKHAKAAKRGSK